ncbi:GPP34 family phosphoprotein [Streptomyces sp. NBC_00829]|uniref:GOLPH3/VPS74 family protein n=1 Tax=Streptomyces sp. NBC_00829 TaxID=2903679 RepID=UPI003863B17D|nr:GPP34 family phosphoprotein [Streptomyces sp. NBC_00829]
MPDGSLSIAARLFLLSWDTERQNATGASQPASLVRAGALTELTRRGLLDDDGGVAVPVGDGRSGDPVLDGLLELIEESRPRTWKKWVTFHARYTLDAVRTQLTQSGYLRRRRRRVLGIFPAARYEIDRPGVVVSLREDARAVLAGPVPVAEVSGPDAALVVLAAAAEVRALATAQERSLHKERIGQLAERGGEASPTLRKVIQEMRTAVIEAATTNSTTASADGC